MRWIGALAVAILPGVASAQSVGHDVENGFKDILHVLGSPGRIDTDNWAGLGLFAAGTTAMMVLDKPIYEWTARNPDALPLLLLAPFREGKPGNWLGRSGVLFGASAVAYGAGWAFDSRDVRQAGLGCMAAATSATFTRAVTNKIIGRSRPKVGHGPFELSLFARTWDQHSFPGGHAAHVMSCVSFLNQRFDLGIMEPVLYGVAGAVSVSRVVDGAHWASDTLVGDVYGWYIGSSIAGRQLHRNAASTFTPQAGLTLRVTF